MKIECPICNHVTEDPDWDEIFPLVDAEFICPECGVTWLISIGFKEKEAK